LSVAGLSPAVVDVFGSLVTYTDPSVLPLGVSPACQDVQFTLNGVRTRAGLVSILGPLAGGAYPSAITGDIIAFSAVYPQLQ